MNEQLTGHQQMEANAEARIAELESAESEAMLRAQAEARAMDTQIQQGAERAAKIEDIEERRGSKEIWARNREAEIAIYGSRGYVDADGQVLAEPSKGKLDEIRENPRYGTKRGERERAAENYLADVNDLLNDGFELCQAKLIMDLREEHDATEDRLVTKIERYSDSAFANARAEKARLRHGNDDDLIEKVIREEGLFSRDEYDKFRFKYGDSKRGERKEFQAYRESAAAEDRRQHDADERRKITEALHRKELARERAREYQEAFENGQTQEEDVSEAPSAVSREEAEGADEPVMDSEPSAPQPAVTPEEEDTGSEPADAGEAMQEDAPSEPDYVDDEPAQPAREDGDATDSNDGNEPVTAETEELPVEPAGEDENSAAPSAEGDNQAAEDESRWARLKRGFWKHMYETPIDMSPMGPTIQPERPFEEWYADKQTQPGRISRAAEKTAEKLGELTDFVDYIGNTALINTAYYAGNAADAVRFKLEDGKDAAEPGAEFFNRAKQRAGYLGRLALDRMVALPARLRERMKQSSDETEEDEDPSAEGRRAEIVERAIKQDPWSWEEDWGWED